MNRKPLHQLLPSMDGDRPAKAQALEQAAVVSGFGRDGGECCAGGPAIQVGYGQQLLGKGHAGILSRYIYRSSTVNLPIEVSASRQYNHGMSTARAPGKKWIIDLGRRLDGLIAAKGFASEQQFCRSAGLGAEAVRSIRRGHAPDAATVLAMATALGVSVEYLLTEKHAPRVDITDEDRIVQAVRAVYEAQRLASFRATADEFAIMLLHYLALQRIPEGDEAAREALTALRADR